MSKGLKITMWVISGLLTALFLFAGLPKLLMPAKIMPMWVQFGYAPWFLTFIGVCETLGAIGLMIPRLAALAASGLCVIMIGAFYSLASHHQLVQSLGPLVWLAVLILVIFLRRKEAKHAPPKTRASGA